MCAQLLVQTSPFPYMASALEARDADDSDIHVAAAAVAIISIVGYGC